jgi:hypothetical protein
MFKSLEAVNVHIVIAQTGERVTIPAITTGDEYTGTRVNKVTQREVPTQYVEAITWHDVQANQSRTGVARKYYKEQRQSVAFMSYRTEGCPELDDFTLDELRAKVMESSLEIQGLTAGRPAAVVPANTIVPKAALAPQATDAIVQPRAALEADPKVTAENLAYVERIQRETAEAHAAAEATRKPGRPRKTPVTA